MVIPLLKSYFRLGYSKGSTHALVYVSPAVVVSTCIAVFGRVVVVVVRSISVGAIAALVPVVVVVIAAISPASA